MVKILYKDKDFFVIDKRAGEDVNDISGEGKNIFLVHRLDKDTSGILVIAESEEMQKKLQKQWKERKVRKTYIALLSGRLVPARGIIDSPITRSRMDRKKMSVSVSADARTAQTEYFVKKYYSGTTLVEAYPKTGRTHQIRVHFSAIGHPVAGDKKYGNSKLNKKFAKHGLSRQFLHASELIIRNPNTGKELHFKSPITKDLRVVLDNIE